eukprot:1345689-Amphidinium_carterae.2
MQRNVSRCSFGKLSIASPGPRSDVAGVNDINPARVEYCALIVHRCFTEGVFVLKKGQRPWPDAISASNHCLRGL